MAHSRGKTFYKLYIMKFLVYGLSNGWGGVEAIIMGMVSRLCREHSFDILLSDGD